VGIRPGSQGEYFRSPSSRFGGKGRKFGQTEQNHSIVLKKGLRTVSHQEQKMHTQSKGKKGERRPVSTQEAEGRRIKRKLS